MKAKQVMFVGAAMLCVAVLAQAQGVQTVSEVESRQSSADLDAFKKRVAAANPGLDVVKIEEDVVRRAVLAPPPPPPPAKPADKTKAPPPSAKPAEKPKAVAPQAKPQDTKK